MSLNPLSDPAAVVAALDEYDSAGTAEFPARYGYGRTRTHHIERDGTSCNPPERRLRSPNYSRYGWLRNGGHVNVRREMK